MAVQWTTHVFDIHLNEDALAHYDKIIVTLRSGSRIVEKTNEDLVIDLETDTVSVRLSQEETSILGEQTKLQMNIFYEDGTRKATDIFQVRFIGNLHGEIME